MVFERKQIDLPGETTGTIAVVADSHSQLHDNALQLIAEQKPDAILHAGDIGELSVLDALQGIAPTHAVRGNIDGHDPRTPDWLVVEVFRNQALATRILLTHIAVYGPKLRKEARERAKREQAHLVVCGHSHVPLIARDAGISVFNPGSLGPRRFQLPIVFGVLSFAKSLSLRHIDCETGAVWMPPPV